MLSILLFPHLPLRSVTEVGTWVLAPIGALGEHPVLDDRRDVVSGLLSLYALPESLGRFGAVAYGKGGKIGDPFEAGEIPPLRRAVTTALLHRNPKPSVPDPRRPIGRGNVATTDNGAAWGHNIQDDGWVAAEYGFMARTLHGGFNVLDPEAQRFPRSPDLLLPMMGDLDGEYAAALMELTTNNTEDGRRLSTAIDWLLVAWQNTSVMDGPLRVMALKTGFEVLLDASKVWTLRDRLSALLDADDAPRSLRTWTKPDGDEDSDELTDLQWGFQKFTFLRNDIAHGKPITPASFTHDTGEPLLFLGEWWLRRAIHETVARAGHEDLRLTPTARHTMRRLRELGYGAD
jgi:hypothetical protein